MLGPFGGFLLKEGEDFKECPFANPLLGSKKFTPMVLGLLDSNVHRVNSLGAIRKSTTPKKASSQRL